MKLVIILSVLTVIQVASSELVNEDDLSSWNEYKSKFGKNYKSPEEEAQRMKIFLENKQYVMSFNMKSEVSFTQSVNEMSDMTQDEINSSRNGFRSEDPEPNREVDQELIWSILLNLNSTFSQAPAPKPADDRSWVENVFSPESLDYRASGRVTKVKDQGSCGSCWSFAAVGALESMLLHRGKPILLSEQNLVDCSRRYGNHGCSGGLMNQAFSYIRDHGIMSLADYPYTAKEQSCKFVRQKSVASLKGSVILPAGNEPILRMSLSLTGPLPVAIDASAKSFHHYKSGVYNDRSCRSSMQYLNHAVLLVGYGTDPKHGDYWILKNSWGTNWGDHGYIKVARNSRNLCGVATFAVLPVP